MKYIFFLTIIPFLFIPSVYAETVNYQDHEEEIIGINAEGNTIIKWTQTLGTNRILDNGQYKDYIFTETPNYLQVEAAIASVRLDKITCEFSFFNSGVIGGKRPLLIDSIEPHQQVSGSGVWNLINVINDETCDASWNGNELIASKQKTGMGYMDHVFILQGKTWKEELRVKNESGLNNRMFGFKQFFNLNRDTINFGGQQRNIDNFDGQIFDRTFLENNEGKIINLLNGYSFDFDLGFNKLNSIIVNDTGGNSSLLTFEYFFNQTVLPDGKTLIIDPTFSDDTVNLDVSIDEGNSNNVCDDTGGSYALNDNTLLYAYAYDVAHATQECIRSWTQFDTSTIPVGVTFSSGNIDWNVSIKYDNSQTDLYLVTSQDLTTRTATQAFDEIDDDLLLGSISPSGTGSVVYNFDAGDLTALEAENTANNFLTIGMRLNDETVNGPRGQQYLSSTGVTPPVLTIIYNTINAWNPGPPINPSATKHIQNIINFTWTPDNATGVSGYALFNASSNSSNPSDWTWLENRGNVTGNIGNFTLKNLSYCLDMWLKTSAFSLNNGTNSTGVYGKSRCGPPNAVDSLTSPDQTFSSIILNWDQPNLKGGILDGYQINFSDPSSENPITIIVNDTGTSGTSYEIGSLSDGEYSFRVSVWTEGGNNATGNIINATTLATVGSFSVNATNPDIVPIRFERTEINDTQTDVNVIFSNTYDPFNCELNFDNAQESILFNELDSSVYDTDFNYSTFQIVNSTNDVITFNCYDVATNETGKYVLTLSSGSIPLIEQVQGFQGGQYGTAGDFGALDLVTLLIVIVSMVGLNRVNQAAGVIISFMVMFGLAAFELIEIPTLLFGSIAVIIMLVVSSTRKP